MSAEYGPQRTNSVKKAIFEYLTIPGYGFAEIGAGIVLGNIPPTGNLFIDLPKYCSAGILFVGGALHAGNVIPSIVREAQTKGENRGR